MPAPSCRDRLIDVAADLFYADGFHAVGLDRLLEAVGVTKTTFYNHFDSKDDLIIAVLQRRDSIENDEFFAAASARAHNDPRASILALFDVLHDWFADKAFRGCIFLNAGVSFPAANDPIHRAAAAHSANLAHALEQLLSRAGDPDPAPTARQIALLISGCIVGRVVNHDHNAALTARSVAQTLLAQRLPALVPA